MSASGTLAGVRFNDWVERYPLDRSALPMGIIAGRETERSHRTDRKCLPGEEKSRRSREERRFC